MNFRQLECFLKAAELLSFSAAAEELFLTQPAVTHHIAQLELELGCSLFVRGHRSIALSDMGRLLFARTHQTMEELEEALEELRQAGAEARQSLLLGHFGPEHDPRFFGVIGDFSALHPTVRTETRLLRPAAMPAAVLSGSLDVAFLPDIVIPKGGTLCCRRLFPQQSVCVMSRRNPLSRRESLLLGDLKRAAVLLPRWPREEMLTHQERRLCARRGSVRLIPNELGMRESFLRISASEEEILIALGPLCGLPEGLVQVPFADGAPIYASVIWKGQNPKPQLRAFLQHLSTVYIPPAREAANVV